jgi:glycosyltransferase involved in cell wall biosynthesis/predicted metal-dependent phosphoesterase TrpH
MHIGCISIQGQARLPSRWGEHEKGHLKTNRNITRCLCVSKISGLLVISGDEARRVFYYYNPKGENKMFKADLHVHSRYSSTANDWMMKRMGAIESYTEPEDIYRVAKHSGMSFVTITDHNSIEGVLKLRDKYPDDVFTGVEVTTQFPEDGCKVHVLVYGLEEDEWREINSIRSNIYVLRDYIREQNLAHSVAHAVYSVNRKLTVTHLEKLLVLFDTFEGMNAGRNRFNSHQWKQLLESLSVETMKKLADKHTIEPYSSKPWIKGFTAGSDDHSALFIARAWTETDADSPEKFLDCIRQKQTVLSGTHNTYRDLALSIYKISHEYTKHYSSRSNKSMIYTVNELIFNDKPISLNKRLHLFRLKHFSKRKQLWQKVDRMVNSFRLLRGHPVSEKIPVIESSVDSLADAFLCETFSLIENAVQSVSPGGTMKALQSFISGVLLSTPYMSSIKDLYKSRNVINEITNSLSLEQYRKTPRILWISDTFDHLNGVAVTIHNILEKVSRNDRYCVKALVSVPKTSIPEHLHSMVINIPFIREITPDFYNTVTMRFPSLTRTLNAIESFEPDKIVISTPGPLGILGLMAAHLLGIPSTAVYHTDFTAQAVKMMGDTYLTECIEKFTRLFYNFSDSIKVPTNNYIDMLRDRRFESSKMSLFGRAVNIDMFDRVPDACRILASRYGLQDGFTFLYAGRVSEDKSISFIADIYTELQKFYPAVNLIVAGDGPDLETFRQKMRSYDGVIFTGRVSQKDMALLYSGSDMLLFPSVTDTFGMVVLEAHACGLPAMVSNIGGPCEIVHHNKTGYVIEADNRNKWINTALHLINMKELSPGQLNQMSIQARKHVEQGFSWDQNLKDLFDVSTNNTAPVFCPETRVFTDPSQNVTISSAA